MNRKVRAKFWCTAVHHFQDNKQADLQVVVDDSGDNKHFAKYTPSGSLTISISNETPASDFFVPGKSYFLDFTDTEAPETIEEQPSTEEASEAGKPAEHTEETKADPAVNKLGAPDPEDLAK